MTALGKGRTATTTGKRKHKEPVVEPVYMSEEEEEESVQEGEEDEEEEEDESVTRCTCGESHSVGLMVQCDQCEVWQHCECMGLEEQDIPDQYYCEECRPTDHIEIKVGFEKTRRYYKPALPSNFEKKLPKRRTTLNSREASDSWEEILALQNAIEQSKSSSSAVETLETPENQVQQQQSPSIQSMEQTSTNAVQEPEEIEAEVASPRIARQKRTVNGRKQQQQQQQKPSRKSSAEKKAGVKSTTGRKNNTTGGRKTAATKTARSRTSTPQPAAPSTTTSETTTTTTTTNDQSSHLISPSPLLPQPSTPPNSHNNHNNNNNNNNRHHYNHHLFEQLSQSARETSPPAKVRLPSVRMTIPEMNRRANQILEYICSIQVEMATGGGNNNSTQASHSLDARISEAMTKAVMQYEEEIVATTADDDNDDDHNNERPRKRHRPRQPTPILIPEKLDHSSPSSSLSSASTIPLEESDKLLLDEKSVAEEALDRMKKSQQQQSSTEIMDLLTRQVINFQRRFGPLGGGGYEDESSESDGPTTRSRDLNRSYTERAW